MAMVVGVFASIANAEDAVADLLASGYSRNDIRVLVRDRERRSRRDNERTVAVALKIAGLQPAAAHFFAEAICNGAVLVAVHCAAPRAWGAREILDVYNDSDEGPAAAKRPTLM